MSSGPTLTSWSTLCRRAWMLSLFQIAILFAQVSDQSNRPRDEAAIRRTWDSFVTAFNKGDAKACAALYTEDGDRVDSVSGKSFRTLNVPTSTCLAAATTGAFLLATSRASDF
jgi:hypothetical protein